MTKQEAIKALKKHGIKLKLVTPMVFKWDHIELAKQMYGMEKYTVPTKEQYNKIIEIVCKEGLYAIMKEYIEHEHFSLWSSSFEDSSASWHLYFSSGPSGQAYWNSTTKANGFSLAFWKLPENF